MSLQISGTLAVREIRGRNGRFKIGSLITGIGEFSLKTPILEQYDEGSYNGTFELVRIFPRQYIAGNRVTLEVAAQIGQIWLDNAALGVVPPAPELEPEPDDESLPPPPPPPTVQAEPVADPAPPAAVPETLADEALVELFGADLLPLGAVVKLDATVGRNRLRQQTAYLRSQGYVFDSKAMIWTRS